jgi:hypothetical protein
MKKPLMGSLMATPSTRLATSVASALAVETVSAAAFDIAAADHEFRLPALQQRQHLRQLRFVVLQVGIHHGRERRAGGQNALNAGAGQPAPADPSQTSDPAILPREIAHHVRGRVRGIVVDEDDLPGHPFQGRLELLVQLGDVVALVEGGDDDRKRGETRALLRGFDARSDGFIHAAKRISAASGDAKPQCPRKGCKIPQNGSKNANDHEQQARVHPAQPSHCVVVPAPELVSKHQRRRYALDRDGYGVPQGRWSS